MREVLLSAPHAPRPTPERLKFPRSHARFRLAVVNGRVEIADRVRLVGAKGLRP